MNAAVPGRRATGILVGLLCLIWGSTWFVIRAGLQDLPPFTSAGLRFVAAGTIMLGLTPMLRQREGGKVPSVDLWLVIGVVNFGISYGVVYWSETTLPSGLVSLLWAVFPMLVAVLGHHFLPGERLVARQWTGFTLGFIGVGLLFWTDLRDLGRGAIPAGLVLLTSPLVSAFGTIYFKRRGAHASSLLTNRNGMFVGGVLLLALGGLTETDAEFRWTSRAVFSLAYLSLVGTVVTFGLYHWLLRFAPAHRLSLIAYVTPPIALSLGWSLGGEPVTLFTLFGAATILLGVVLVVGRRR